MNLQDIPPKLIRSWNKGQIHPHRKNFERGSAKGHFRYLKRRYCTTVLWNGRYVILDLGVYHQSLSVMKISELWTDKYKGFFKNLVIVHACAKACNIMSHNSWPVRCEKQYAAWWHEKVWQRLPSLSLSVLETRVSKGVIWCHIGRSFLSRNAGDVYPTPLLISCGHSIFEFFWLPGSGTLPRNSWKEGLGHPKLVEDWTMNIEGYPENGSMDHPPKTGSRTCESLEHIWLLTLLILADHPGHQGFCR